MKNMPAFENWKMLMHACLFMQQECRSGCMEKQHLHIYCHLFASQFRRLLGNCRSDELFVSIVIAFYATLFRMSKAVRNDTAVMDSGSIDDRSVANFR